MDKETLSNYGWIVICVLVMVVMIALATPFGSYISEAVQSTTKGLFDVNKTALDSTGLINIDNQEFDVPDMNYGAENGGNAGGSGELDDSETNEGNTNDANSAVRHDGPQIPEGAYYGKIANGKVTLYTEMPSTLSDSEAYYYGDYVYYYVAQNNGWTVDLATRDNAQPFIGSGINIALTDKNQTSYGAVLESINGKPIVSMATTYMYCEEMTVAPKIPNTVVNMSSTFQSCKALINAPEIPDSVVDMSWTFSVCTSLKSAPTIPGNVTNMCGTFEYCQVLEVAPDMSKANKVTDMTGTFYECYSMTTAPVVPSSVTTISRVTFGGCFALTNTISLPCTLESQNVTFKGCPAPVEYYHINNCGH